ncbi:MAG: 16S rRNA (cytosine(1402)-N(4))-methyltransferase RsmH [Eubacterium sp.]
MEKKKEHSLEENDRLETIDNQKTPHKRRPRYKGTHPRNYKEKYKEHQPEKYADTVAKVIQKGSTPAGMHIPICVKEILEFLAIKPGQTGLDVTLGYGGHTLEMLKCLESEGHLYALDVDPIELVKTRERLAHLGYGPEILTIKQLNFANIDQLVSETGTFNFVLADLGVSSMQIDNPDRGFSYKNEGPLDLRLDPKKGDSAADRLKAMTREEIEGMLVENADEPYAEMIAKAISEEMENGTYISTTTQLRRVIEESLSFIPKNQQKDVFKKSCQRTFQALRIDVNSEFEVLYEFLEKLPRVLAKGGRVAILSFHSGEDRLVKKSFKRLFREGVYSEIATELIRPSTEECYLNSRARSAKMRWAIKS